MVTPRKVGPDHRRRVVSWTGCPARRAWAFQTLVTARPNPLDVDCPREQLGGCGAPKGTRCKGQPAPDAAIADGLDVSAPMLAWLRACALERGSRERRLETVAAGPTRDACYRLGLVSSKAPDATLTPKGEEALRQRGATGSVPVPSRAGAGAGSP